MAAMGMLANLADSGGLEALRVQIAQGDDVDGGDGDGGGLTPLMWACGRGHLECAQAMINAGASVDMVDNRGVDGAHVRLHHGSS